MTKKELKELEQIFDKIIDKQIKFQKELHRPKTDKELLEQFKRERQVEKIGMEIQLETLKRLAPVMPQFAPLLENAKNKMAELEQNLIIIDEKLK